MLIEVLVGEFHSSLDLAVESSGMLIDVPGSEFHSTLDPVV